MTRSRFDSRYLLLAALPILWLSQAGQAQASLIGDKVTAEVLFGGAPSGQGPSSAIVGDGLEFDFLNVDIDVRAEGADYTMILGGLVVLDETYLLTDLDWTDANGRIVGVNLDRFGGLSDIPTLRFRADAVAVTIAGGTRVARDAFIRVSFKTVHRPIPEPGAMALFAAGFTTIGFALRRRR